MSFPSTGKSQASVEAFELGSHPERSATSLVQTREIPSSHSEAEERALEGRQWRTGHKERFPAISFWCLIVIICLCTGMIVVLTISDQKDVNSWCSGSFHVPLPHGRSYERSWKISVNVWISMLVFFAGKALAVVFAEAIAVSWWVGAMKGQTLHQLHHDWEASQSIFGAISKPKLFGWICVASIAYTSFDGLGSVLQKASSTSTVRTTYPVNMTATLAGVLPAGFSGRFAASGHDSTAVTFLTSEFIQVVQQYTAKSPIALIVGGCAETSNVSCATTVTGVGFDYVCSAGRGKLAKPLQSVNNSAIQPTQTVFDVKLDFDQYNPWHINLSTQWKDSSESYGEVLATRNCRLIPALVEYPVKVSQGIATLQPATSTISWIQAPALPQQRDQPLVDQVLKKLPYPNYEKYQVTRLEQLLPAKHSTLGGFFIAFSNQFTSSITTTSDITNPAGPDLQVTGGFAAPYAVFGRGLDQNNYALNTFVSPMHQLVADIREIMFRSSVAIVQHNITAMKWEEVKNQYGTLDGVEVKTTHVPSLTTTHLGSYSMYHTVYHTGYVALGIGIALMFTALFSILPLFWGYWRLGRKVSLSPLEMAKALHQPVPTRGQGEMVSVLDVAADVEGTGSARVDGSNYKAKDLVKLLGHSRVRYGVVGDGVLGMGPADATREPKGGGIYH